MSDKNLNTENKIKKPSLLWKIKSQYTIMNIFDLISNYTRPQHIHDMLINQKEPSLKKTVLEMKLRNRINQLGDFRNWFYYLKYIYSAVANMAEKIYYEKYPEHLRSSFNRNCHCNEPLCQEERVFFEFEATYIETIAYVMFIEIAYLAKNKKLFNKNDLQIKRAKSSQKEDMEKVSLEATIFNAIQNALDKSYRDESDDAYKTTINSIYKYLQYASMMDIDNAREHLLKRFPKYQEDKDLKYDLCFLILKILWLKNNRYYKLNRAIYFDGLHYKIPDCEFNQSVLKGLDLPNLKDNTLDCSKPVEYLKKNGDFYSFVIGQSDFDVRMYSNDELNMAISKALEDPTQRNKFQQFLKSKEELKKEKEEPKPNLEKQNSKNLNDEFNSK